MADPVLSFDWQEIGKQGNAVRLDVIRFEVWLLQRSLTFDEVETLYRMVQAYKEAQNG